MNLSTIWPQLSTIHSIVFDFDGVFTDNKVYVDQNGIESVRCDRGDGLAIDFLRCAINNSQLKAELFILSKEPNPVVLARAKKMRLGCHHGVANKKKYIDDYFSQRFPQYEHPYSGFIYLGNDLNDLPLMEKAGFSVAPADAHPTIKKLASVVLEQSGGEGFVRAFVERLLNIAKMSVADINGCIHGE